MSISEREKLPHFVELDGLRGIAALAVFFHHFFQATTNPKALVCQVAQFGFLGVQIFFVLSGFLITSLLFLERRGPHMLHNFYWKRAFRILPPLAIYLAGAFWSPAPGAHTYVLLSALFLANFSGLFGVIPGPAWTLAIEEQFYLLWPQVIRRFRINTVFWISVAIVSASTLLRLGVPIFRHDSISILYTPYQCDGLALGAILACQWFAWPDLEGAARRVSRFLNGRIVVVLWTLLLLAYLLVRFKVPKTGNLQTGLEMTLVVFLTYRVLVLATLKRDHGIGWVQWLRWKPLVFVGSISYGLYLYHGPILEVLYHRLGAPDVTHPFQLTARFCGELLIAVAISWMSYRWIEMPIRGLRRYVIVDGAATTPAAPELDPEELACKAGSVMTKS